MEITRRVRCLINGIPIIGEDAEFYYYYKQGIQYSFVTVGSIGDASRRIRIYRKAKAIGYKFPIIIDKNALVSKNVEVGLGSFIGKGAIINSGSQIGINCIINTGAIIDHDCRIGDFCHISPGSTLSGGITIEKESHIGTNSTIIQNIKIGSNAFIGAGSVVVNDIGYNVKAYGNPCREVEYEKSVYYCGGRCKSQR